MAVTASIGVAIVILTDLILLPVLVSWVKWDDQYRARVEMRQAKLTRALGSARAHHRTQARGHHHRHRRVVRHLRRVEGPRDAHRRHAVGRARTARRFALQPRQQHHHQQVLDRRRHPHGHRGDEGAGLHQPRAHDGHRHLRVEDAQRRRRAGSDGAAHRRQDRHRRLERRQPQVAQHPARAQPAHAVDALHRDQHRPAERGLQRDSGDAVPARSQGRDHRTRGGRGEGVARRSTRCRAPPSTSPPATSASWPPPTRK